MFDAKMPETILSEILSRIYKAEQEHEVRVCARSSLEVARGASSLLTATTTLASYTRVRGNRDVIEYPIVDDIGLNG